LDPENTHVSLFSPLDKTIAIIHPKHDKGYILFILNCQSLQSSTQWYAFVCEALKSPSREKMILVTVPDLDNLQIRVNTYREGVTSIDGEERDVVNGTLISANDIVQRCMDELRKVDQWKDVLDYWEENYEMGLCWKIYDRIEWLKGTMDKDQDELAGSWSLKQVSIAPGSLTIRATIWNFVRKSITPPKFVLGLRNILLNPFLWKDFSSDIRLRREEKLDSVKYFTRDCTLSLTIISCSFVLPRKRQPLHCQTWIIFQIQNREALKLTVCH
jgi:hypothetical protein